MLCRLPTAAVLRAPARISTAAGRASIRAATWTAAAEIVERRTSEFVLGADEIAAGAFHCAGGCNGGAVKLAVGANKSRSDHTGKIMSGLALS